LRKADVAKPFNFANQSASGRLALSRRLYAPKPEALDGRCGPPPVRKR
jgi:hypothetical protein